MEYKCLVKQVFVNGDYELVPIRMEDRWDIMQWRNEQIYHLRQNELLTKEKQDEYFQNVVAKLFDQAQPTQVLFSFLKNDVCIGYGGLVHINWIDKNAEISFIMETALEEKYFEENWVKYLSLIEKVAFNELKLHKIFTYAFDIRPRLYQALSIRGFLEEARLKEHCIINNQKFDVLIHSKIYSSTELLPTKEEDCRITFEWVNNRFIRQFSFQKSEVDWSSHEQWFNRKLSDKNCQYFILHISGSKVGSIRIDINQTREVGLISYLIDPKFHGKGYGKLILELVERKIWMYIDEERLTLRGLVVRNNVASVNIFHKLAYQIVNEEGETLTFEKTITR